MRRRAGSRRSRLVAPTSWATLGVHVVASPGSHGAREGGGLSVHSFSLQNMVFYWDYDDRIKPSTL